MSGKTRTYGNPAYDELGVIIYEKETVCDGAE
jgi:hypothetical protein